jgi:hypothetical protein
LIVTWYCSLTSSSFNCSRLNLSTPIFLIIRLITARLSLTFATFPGYLSRVNVCLPDIRTWLASSFRQVDVYSWQVTWSRQPAHLTSLYLPHVNAALALKWASRNIQGYHFACTRSCFLLTASQVKHDCSRFFLYKQNGSTVYVTEIDCQVLTCYLKTYRPVSKRLSDLLL